MPTSFCKISTRSAAAAVLTATTLAITAFVGAPGASAATRHKSAHDAQSLPAEGIFDNCNLDTQLNACEQSLQTISKGGFQVVVMPAMNTSLPGLSSYASYAHSIGMKVMWEISDPGLWESPGGDNEDNTYSSFSDACNCTVNSQILTYMIKWFAGQPATYGYYAADDSMISPGQGSELTAYSHTIEAADPTDTVMIGSSPQQGQSNEGAADMLGNEIYPVTNYDLSPASQHLADWESVDQSIEQGQRAATAAGKQSAFILQAFTFGDNLDDGEAVGVCTPSMSQQQCYGKLDYPSAATQLQLRNEVLEHSNAKLILWYSFSQTDGQSGNDTYSTYPTGGTAANRWSGLTAAINAPYSSSPVATVARASGKKPGKAGHHRGGKKVGHRKDTKAGHHKSTKATKHRGAAH
jgi:hypothetical protein